MGIIMEREKAKSATGGEGGEVEDSTQVEEGAEAKNQAATVTSKAQAQETKGQPKKVVEAGEQLLDPIKDLKKMSDNRWRELNYAKKKTHLLSELPGFLRQHLSPEKVRNALHLLSEQSASEFLHTLQPGNFKMFLN